MRTLPEAGPPVLISSGGGGEPQWAPNGREVFYRGEGGMVVATVTVTIISR